MLHLTPTEVRHLLQVGRRLDLERSIRMRLPRLAGAHVALLAEDSASHVRAAVEVAAHRQGAHLSWLRPEVARLGPAGSVADAARVLGRLYDGLGCQGTSQQTLMLLAEHAGVPVWNLGTEQWAPAQALADLLTVREATHKPDDAVVLACCGDARTPAVRSLLVGAALLAMDVRVVAPQAWRPSDELVAAVSGIAASTGARIRITEDPAAVAGADVVYTAAPGADETADAHPAYRVDAQLLAATGNPGVRFLHPLPATALEVSEDVFTSPHSAVVDQAENLVYAVEALLVATLGG